MAEYRDIRPTITKLLPKLVEEIGPRKVVLFGSYVHGEPDGDSDIDLLIIADMQEDFFRRLAKVRRAISGLHRGIPLDAIVLTPEEVEERVKAGDTFIKEALEWGEVLYAA